MLADPSVPEEDWEQVDSSPFLLQVDARECDGDLEAKQDGTCGCPSGTWHTNGEKCLTAAEYGPIIAAVVIVVLAIAAWVATVYLRKHNDTLWQIDAEDVLVNETPEVLGQGSFGVVIKVKQCRHS